MITCSRWEELVKFFEKSSSSKSSPVQVGGTTENFFEKKLEFQIITCSGGWNTRKILKNLESKPNFLFVDVTLLNFRNS